jgi:hypothetical protein
VVVDVLAPGPLPEAEAAAVQARVVEGEGGAQLRVTVRPKAGSGDAKAAGKRGGAKATAEGAAEACNGVTGEHRVDLPQWVGSAATVTTKLSRRLGLMSVHVT